MGESAWGWVSVAAIGCVILLGFPFLLRGGGLLHRRRAGRDGFRIRVGPSAPAVIATALLRHIDTFLLIAATAVFLILVMLNARA